MCYGSPMKYMYSRLFWRKEVKGAYADNIHLNKPQPAYFKLPLNENHNAVSNELPNIA